MNYSLWEIYVPTKCVVHNSAVKARDNRKISNFNKDSFRELPFPQLRLQLVPISRAEGKDCASRNPALNPGEMSSRQDEPEMCYMVPSLFLMAPPVFPTSSVFIKNHPINYISTPETKPDLIKTKQELCSYCRVLFTFVSSTSQPSWGTQTTSCS